jgi:hypothetical protein
MSRIFRYDGTQWIAVIDETKYAPASLTASAIDAKVSKSGDTMTGELAFSASSTFSTINGSVSGFVTAAPTKTDPVTSTAYTPTVRVGEVYFQPGIYGVNGSHFHILGQGTVKIRGGGVLANPTDTHVGIDGSANLTTSGRISCLGGALNFADVLSLGVHLSRSNSGGETRPRIILSTGSSSQNIGIENFGGEAVIRGSNGFEAPFRCSTATTNSVTVNSGSSQTNITSFGTASVIQAANGHLALAPVSGSDVQLQGQRTTISSTTDNPLRVYTGVTNGPYIGLYASDLTTRRGWVGYGDSSTLSVNNGVTNGNILLTTTGASGDINLSTAGTINLSVSSGERGRWYAGGLMVGRTTTAVDTSSGVLIVGIPGNGQNGQFFSTIESTGSQSNFDIRRYAATAGQGATANGQFFARFLRNSTVIGSISIATSTTTGFNTSSDARLKTEVDGESPLAVIDRLQPRWFVWNEDQTIDYGFFAQEANEVWPNAVSPGGDDVNEDPWMMDQSKLVGLLVGAVQELSARVEELEQRS